MLGIHGIISLLTLGLEALSIHPGIGNPRLAPTLQHLPWRCETLGAGTAPTNWADCRHLADMVADLASPKEKLVFSTDKPDKGRINIQYQMPATFRHESCSATIKPIRAGMAAQEALTSRYLGRVVLEMARMCVGPSPHLGGVGGIGEKGMIFLALLGPKRGPGVRLGGGLNATDFQY